MWFRNYKNQCKIKFKKKKMGINKVHFNKIEDMGTVKKLPTKLRKNYILLRYT